MAAPAISPMNTMAADEARGHDDASSVRVVILAGGKGVRLRPFTVNFPKPLVPLGDTPIIEVLIERLLAFGIKDITLTLGHLADLMRAYFSHRCDLTRRFNLQYVEEREPTGTAGSLSMIPGLDDTFLVMNGDLLTDLDVRELLRFHREQGATLTIAAHQRRIKIDLGVLKVDDNHCLIGYDEKPEMSYQVSMGIYAFEPEVLRYIDRGSYLDFPDLVLRLIRAGKKVCAYPSDCLWLDIGRPDDYSKAQELFTEAPHRFEHV